MKFKFGNKEIDPKEITYDPRGSEEAIKEIVENEWTEGHYSQFGGWMTPFCQSSDLAEWDSFLIDRYSPSYGLENAVCHECGTVPCDLEKEKDRCGLSLQVRQAKGSLLNACKGCMNSMLSAREILNHAVKLFGYDQPASMGRNLAIGDAAVNVGILTALHVKTLRDVEKALSYAESQLLQILSSVYFSNEEASAIEQKTFHVGSLLMLAMEATEIVKISCFGFVSAANHKIDELENFPPANVVGGLSSVDTSKTVVLFVGENFIPAWACINSLKEKGALDKVEVCAVSPAADDIIRFYDACKVLGPAAKTWGFIRSGIADVVVIQEACGEIDKRIVDLIKGAGSKVIWTGRQNIGFRDETQESLDAVTARLAQDGATGTWIRDYEKAGGIASALAAKVMKGAKDHADDGAYVREAKKCIKECSACPGACPNNLDLKKAIGDLSTGDWKGMLEVEGGCYFCGNCEKACPANIPIRDMIVSSWGKKPSDRFVMRAGRGPTAIVEQLQSAFAIMWGTSPGVVAVMGCGNAPNPEDIGWIAKELVFQNCIVFTAGCGAAEIGKFYDESEKKFIYEKYGATTQARNLINCGGCAASCHPLGFFIRYMRPAGGISHYGNLMEVSNGIYQVTPCALILWGVHTDRMYAIASGYARIGIPSIVGPVSDYQWARLMKGNKNDRSKWWVYHGDTGKKREIEPVPENLIARANTKEEAVYMASRLFVRPGGFREARRSQIETAVEISNRYFGKLPDDWNLWVRSDMELPARYKFKLMKLLREEHGWVTDDRKILKAKHRDGRLLPMEEFNSEYGLEQGTYLTNIFKLLPKNIRSTGDKKGG